MPQRKKPTIVDVANALGVSTATVSRALHNGPNVAEKTKARIVRKANQLGFRPNLAARYLSSTRKIRISVNTLKGTTSFWDKVRQGIAEEYQSAGVDHLEIVYRTYHELGGSETEAFEGALEDGVDGIIAFPGDPDSVRPLMRSARRRNIPVVFVASDVPGTGRLSVISVDTFASGALAADLMGRLIGGTGEVAVTLFDVEITEHAQKFEAFRETMTRWYPGTAVVDPIEDRDVDEVGYEKMRRLIGAHPGLKGVYVTTEASMPVIRALRDEGRLETTTLITTDLFPGVVRELRAGTIAATIYQRPRTQGRMAFRVLHQYLRERKEPVAQLTFAPHLVMRGNADFFLKKTPRGSRAAGAGG